MRICRFEMNGGGYFVLAYSKFQIQEVDTFTRNLVSEPEAFMVIIDVADKELKVISLANENTEDVINVPFK